MADTNGTRFCESCGSPLTPGQRFCESCGAVVPEIPAQPDYAQPYQQPAYEQPQQPYQQPYQQPAYTQPAPQQPKKKTGLIIALCAIAALIVVGVVAFLLLGGGANLSSEEKMMVGTWKLTEMADFSDYSTVDCSTYGYTMTLKSDHTGVIKLDDDTYDITWSFDKVDDDGDYRYAITISGENSFMFYVFKYDEIWLYVGSDLCLTFVKK